MDYAAVAGSIVLGTAGVRACLVVSQDGLPLAAYPAAEEAAASAVWSRLATVGPISRGFLTMQSEVWAFVQGDRYGALILADRSVRPGQVIEFAEQALAEAAAAAVLAGADRRSEAGAMGRPDLRDRGIAGRRLPTLHRGPADREPEAAPAASASGPAPAPAEIVVSLEEGFLTATRGSSEYRVRGGSIEAGFAGSPGGEEAVPAEMATAEPAPPGAPEAAADTAMDPPAEGADGGHENAAPDGSHPEPGAPQREGRAGGEVDIIALAREFAGLIIERD